MFFEADGMVFKRKSEYHVKLYVSCVFLLLNEIMCTFEQTDCLGNSVLLK